MRATTEKAMCTLPVNSDLENCLNLSVKLSRHPEKSSTGGETWNVLAEILNVFPVFQIFEYISKELHFFKYSWLKYSKNLLKISFQQILWSHVILFHRYIKNKQESMWKFSCRIQKTRVIGKQRIFENASYNSRQKLRN